MAKIINFVGESNITANREQTSGVALIKPIYSMQQYLPFKTLHQTSINSAVAAAALGNPVAAGGNPVAVGGNPVAVGGNPVAVGGNPVAVGGNPVAVAGNPVAVGGNPVAVGADIHPVRFASVQVP